MDILDDMGVSKLSAKVFFFKVIYFFNHGLSVLHCLNITICLILSTWL